MNKERILALADLIEQQPHVDAEDVSGFNMDAYTHSCGTPSCIAGFASATAGFIRCYFEGEAKKWLDIEDSSLFRPETIPTDDWILITPQMAAKTLRILATTGEVDWSHTGLEYRS